MTRWIRNRPDRREDALASLVAGSLGAVVGLMAFYVVRLVLARDPVVPLSPPKESGQGNTGLDEAEA